MIRIINNDITEWELPLIGVLADGRTVSGYNELEKEILYEENWYDENRTIPIYDPETEYVVFDYFTVNGHIANTFFKVLSIQDLNENSEEKILEEEI